MVNYDTSVRPKKANLFPLQNLKINSPMVESLTSYISRIAEAHSITVGAFINGIIVPKLHKEYLSSMALSGGTRFYVRANNLNGISTTSTEIIGVLEKLTGSHTLRYSTLGGLNGLISARNLVRYSKAWCPICLNESKTLGQIYEPLIWSLNCVNICLKHHIWLESHCPNPNCGKTIPFLSRSILTGYCPHCGRFLGSNTPPTKQIGNFDELLPQLTLIKKLITINQTAENRLNCEAWKKTLDTYIVNQFNGSSTNAALFFGIPKSTLWYWQNTSVKPTLEDLLKVSMYISFDPFELFCSAQDEEPSPGRPKRIRTDFRNSVSVK